MLCDMLEGPKGAFIVSLIKISILKYAANIEVFFDVLILDSLLQSVQVNKANIGMHNFVNCSILPYSVSTFKLNNDA